MDDYVRNMLEVIRLVPLTVSGRRLPDPTPFTVTGWTDVLRFDETSSTNDYWVFRFTAIVKPERQSSPSLEHVIDNVPRGPLEPFTMSPETIEWFRRLALRQGMTNRQARAIAYLATKAERTFARSIATISSFREQFSQTEKPPRSRSVASSGRSASCDQRDRSGFGDDRGER
jgi:hypothetical protein